MPLQKETKERHPKECLPEVAVPTNLASTSKPLTAPHALVGEDLVRGNIVRDSVVPNRLLKETRSMVQRVVESDEPPPWREQITVRSIIFGLVLGFVFTIITMKLNLTAGIIPSLGMPVTLIGFAAMNLWGALLEKLGFVKRPFTAQENLVLQTLVGGSMGAAFAGGFGSFLLGMDHQSFLNTGGERLGNRLVDVYDPVLSRTIPYMICISFLGIFLLVSLRKRFILDYDLPYPSGTAGGVLINSLHSKGGSDQAKEQVRELAKWGGGSLAWSAFAWVFSSTEGINCSGGFGQFPSFGLDALKWHWNFDFGQTYIGVGMICPHIVNASMMLGAIVSWGIMWPLIGQRAGDWFPSGLSERDFRGLFGYKVFLAMAIFIGDGLYNLFKVLWTSGNAFYKTYQSNRNLPHCTSGTDPVLSSKGSGLRTTWSTMSLLNSFRRSSTSPNSSGTDGSTPPGSDSPGQGNGSGTPLERVSPDPSLLSDEAKAKRESALLTAKRNRIFLKDAIPDWVAYVGYIAFGVLGVIVIPLLYPPCKWYMVVIVYIVAPFFCFANAYAAGLTDWDMASMYGKLCIFAFAAWAGPQGGVIAGLAICGVVLATANAAAGLMFDFKTGWITLSSPRAMFVAQLIGSGMGCIVAPLVFNLFYTAFPIGQDGSAYAAPYATVYRAMAILGTQGFSALPTHCLQLFIAWFFIAIIMAVARDVLPSRYATFVPIPSAFGLPFYLGPNYAVTMGLGSLIKFVWEKSNPAGAEKFVVPAAAGLIVGDGMFSVPAAILALAKVEPPICMSFAKAAVVSTGRRLMSITMGV